MEKILKKYCLWRNYNFREFESLDSNIHNSIFKAKNEEDWTFSISNGIHLTDIISDNQHAEKCAKRLHADEILNFDFIESENPSCDIIGYEILDCAFSYSLLTNFGNDIDIVNICLARNALIRHKEQAELVHKWFLDHMTNDPHVMGSRIFVVYKKSAWHVT